MSVLKDKVSVQDQLLASLSHQMEIARQQAMNMAIDQQDKALLFAIKQIDEVKEQLKDPSNFLGRMDTKHGEVAEKIEVAIRNAKEALNQQVTAATDFSATFEGVGRIAPEDYIIDGVEVQSKFINGLNNNLKHVMDHMEKYEQFGRDGSYYHIPKDTHQQIQKILDGESVDGVKLTTINAIKEKVGAIEALSGKSFNEVVQPGNSTYDEVQLYRADGTLEQHNADLKVENDVKIADIKADDAYKESLGEMGNAALGGAVVGAGVSFVSNVYQKHKQGRNLFKGQFSKSDWKELGIDMGKASLIGGFSGAALYGLTNYAAMSAPFAGAVVTASKGVGSLSMQYKSGELGLDEFIDLSLLVCGESAAVGLASMVGQTLIPIPVVGALVGSMAAKFCIDLIKRSDEKIINGFQKRVSEFSSSLNAKELKVFKSIESKFEHLTSITDAAFDLENNANLLELSVDLAREHHVPEDKIIKSISDLDDFMLG
ncbi:hypothetical protein HWV01_16350 [Moritella sp. 5]|uniref:hypothetical protein n=1 Tax=Moritella sp. 5 TaxID=2746231 RepID=UPI001BA4A7C6|nr:hypothetical protein [Moritella sp. 5]QUM81744.1 hypothetical protein HWV01_16350 [Moritella sp. 5]